MTNTELKTLEELLSKDSTKGKKLLERFLWLNTHEPKYKIGECYRITDRGHYIYEVEIRNMKGKIVEIRSLSEERRYTYKLELEIDTTNGKHCTISAWNTEEQIGEPVENNMNIITPKGKHRECIDCNFTC